jgi:predicted lipoprotein with Yx(FWY)xxD motif
MKRLMILPALATAGALAVAGCGGGGSSSSSDSNVATAASGPKTVSIKKVASAGNVLVDKMGNSLYSPDQEKSGKITCTGACTSVWVPLRPSGGAPAAGPGVGHLSAISRPDGGFQVAVDGKPLYTFSQDQPGEITGQNAQDAFGGKHFTWHVVTPNGSAPATPKTTASGGKYGGY